MIDYLLVSIAISLLGVVFNLYPPSRLYGKYGYRSKAALRSKENWELAQRLARRYVLMAGVIGLVVALGLYQFGNGNSARMLSVVVPILFLLIAIYLIERRLQ